MRKSVKAALCLTTVLFVAVLLTEFEVIFFGENSKPQKSDCIIVLGCRVYGTTPSPFLKARLEEGLRLYNKGYGSYIIVSGGRGSGENISEAAAMKNYLVYKGIDASKIIAEERSYSTQENLANSKAIMKVNGFKSAVVVSNKYHLKRASIEASSQKMQATYSGVFVSEYEGHEILGYIREIPAVWKYSISNMLKKV